METDEDLVGQASALVGSMLSAGLDRQAARWWPVLQGASDSDAAEGWALLSIGAPSALPVSESRIRGWAQRDESVRGRHRAELLVAALEGLGRLDGRVVDEVGAEYGDNLSASRRNLRQLDKIGRAHV